MMTVIPMKSSVTKKLMHANNNNNQNFIEHFWRLKALLQLKEKHVTQTYRTFKKKRKKYLVLPWVRTLHPVQGYHCAQALPSDQQREDQADRGDPQGLQDLLKRCGLVTAMKNTQHYHNSMLYTIPVNMPGMIRISLEALARSWLDDSCTPACSWTGSVWPKPDTISQKQIGSGLVLHNMIQAV